MKTAWILIILGILLLIDGIVRITMSFFVAESYLLIGGLTTGLLLGSFCLYKGINRKSKYKKMVSGREQIE